MMVLAVRERSHTMPQRFRLIPVDVSAIKITDADSIARAVLWAGGVESTTDNEFTIYVPSVNEILRVSLGDYLVKDATGFTKMTAEEFERKYERI